MPTILLVDDELTNVKVLVDFLKNEGFKILVARSGESALQQLEYVQPDLLLLDVKMPGIDGFEVCRRVKRNEAARDIPIIFITALFETIDKVKGFGVGGVDYITKPFQKEEVLARVRIHLNNRRFQHQLQEEKARFQALSEATFEGIIIHDQGKIVEINRTMVNLFGYTREELLGRSLQDLLPAFLSKHSEAALPYETEGVRSNGSRFPLEIHVRPFTWQAHGLQVVAVRDMTWRKELEQENLTLRVTLDERSRFGKMIGRSPTMKKVYERIVKAATSDETVIIYGETGTGKELAARMIFELGEHHAKSFVPVNCGAIQESLFESLFFGHRKGAFTGADRDASGYFKQAEGGTLFLDEIGELTPVMQVKLLRVLEDKTYAPVGTTTNRRADVRIIAATNRELKELRETGQIRDDFFQRIHIIVVKMPPLRYRKEDIPLLVEHFLAQKASSGNPRVLIPTDLMEQLCAYEWPGNVRELFNELRRYATTGEVELAGEKPTVSSEIPEIPFLRQGLLLSEAVTAFEEYYITHTLQRYQGQKIPTAEALGIDRKTLYNKLKRYNEPEGGE